jgi:hypothetical protein
VFDSDRLANAGLSDEITVTHHQFAFYNACLSEGNVLVASKSKPSKTRDTVSRRTYKTATGKKRPAIKALDRSARPLAKTKEHEHIRLPLRSDLVEGKEKLPGVAPKTLKNLDPRTESQDPVLKK